MSCPTKIFQHENFYHENLITQIFLDLRYTLSNILLIVHRPQSPGSIVYGRNIIVSFFALDHTHCHPSARAQLSGNRVQPLKPLNKATQLRACWSLFTQD